MNTGRGTIGALAVTLTLTLTTSAHAGEPPSITQPVLPAQYFRVALCKAAPFNVVVGSYAFTRSGRRPKMTAGACREPAPGQRAIVTASDLRPRSAVAGSSYARVTIFAPPHTTFEQLLWGGVYARLNCRFDAVVTAFGPGGRRVPVLSVPHAERCARERRKFTRLVAVPGTTGVQQRVMCFAPQRYRCTQHTANYIHTTLAELLIHDPVPPTLTAGSSALNSGSWINTLPSLPYDATDNVGVRKVVINLGDDERGRDNRVCSVARAAVDKLGEAFGNALPCPNGPGSISPTADGTLDGTHQLSIVATDVAGNTATVAAGTLRLDRIAPQRVDVTVAGGGAWSRDPQFAVTWTGETAGDRSPITAVSYRLCPAAGGDCVTVERDGGEPSMAVVVPAPGDWRLALWQRDGAGNSDSAQQSEPVALRHDPIAPQLAFQQRSASDPTLLSASVSDALSGVASGAIEVSRQGSGTWHALPTQLGGEHLTARLDDALLAPGVYSARATATDHAGNVAISTHDPAGPVRLTLPLRNATTLHAGIPHTRIARVLVRTGGRKRLVRRRVTSLRPVVRARHASTVRVRGQLKTRDGSAPAGAPLDVHALVDGAPPRHVGVLRTDHRGRFTHAATATASQTLRYSYSGSAHLLPAVRDVRLRVPAKTSILASRRYVLNGDVVTFSGKVHTQPIPPYGKLVELQVWLSTRWQTFRTITSDPHGRWKFRYRFQFVRSPAATPFRFRIKLAREAAYPYDTGLTRPIVVLVRGR